MDGEAKFSILERYGENYTEKEYITNPAIGRDQQIKELLLILLTPEKSAILVGKPGIGKTAIVEGLAYAIQNKQVPEALIGYTIINIKTASLLGTMPNGESKVQVMIDELKDKEKIILFVDEIHMLIGATDESSLDFANIFKEGLGRGSIKVVGATTTEEYERYILRDKAFTRRFQKVNVPEPTRDETVSIMMGTLPKLEKTTGVRLKYSKYQQELIMGFIVDLTSEYKRVFEVGSRYPDIALTLLKSAFSFTVFDNRKEVNIFDFEKAILNTHLVYEDVVKKEMPLFKEKFKDMYNEEAGIVKEGIVIPNTSTAPLEQPTIDLEPVQENNIPQAVTPGISAPTTITAMGTRDERVKPTREDTSTFNDSLMNGVVLTPEEPKKVEEPVVETPPPKVQTMPKEEFEGVYYTPTASQIDGMYDNPVRVTAMGRDERVVPNRDSSTALDGVLTSNQAMMQAPTNFNLDLEDRDDLDNKDDDFFDE
ncbi:MAG: ATP-dependent Clp protease ATP-binding subunit [Bacilli bacterium]|nr:ATP-dependent Clp protease ATP-binding subunit [Bacilli bacterium]